MFIDRHLSNASACYYLLKPETLPISHCSIDGEKSLYDMKYGIVAVFMCFVCINNGASVGFEALGMVTRKFSIGNNSIEYIRKPKIK